MADLSHMTPQAVAAWDALTSGWGAPLQVTSGYRSPTYNTSVGGAKGSQHIHGNAYDVSTAGMSGEDIARLARQAIESGFSGVGAYDGSLHFDVGPSRFWGPDYTSASAPDWLRAVMGGDHLPTNEGSTMRQTGDRQQQRPQGLLDLLGVQRRGSGGPQGDEPFYKRDRFKDVAGNLAVALNEMRLRPSAAIPQMVQAGRDRRQQSGQVNRTTEWLSQQPGSEPYLQMIQAGGNPAAVLQAYQAGQAPSAPTKGIEVDGRLVNPVTGEVMYEPEGGSYDPESLSSLRKEFVGLAPVKDFTKQASAYGRIIASVDDPSPAGDLALIFNYMKVLDPGSTVREGEFATAQNAAGVDQRTLSMYNRVMEGTRLTEQQRGDFADRATRLYQDAEDQFGALRGQYETIAQAQQLPVDLALPSFAYSGEKYQTPLALTPPAAPAGTDPSVWPQVWENMTDEQRRLFVENSQ